MIRKVKKSVTGSIGQDGAGVKLVRLISYNDVKEFDPFLMLDAFDSIDSEDYVKGFPWHPHRGIETVTYLIEGEIIHGDSIGNEGAIKDLSCQWMTAGSGILHQEMPQPVERMLGVQLWLNLPKKDKMKEPGYLDIPADSIPVVSEEDSITRIMAGTYQEMKGAAHGNYVDMGFFDVAIKGQGQWSHTVNQEETVFIYIVEGTCSMEDSDVTYQGREALLLDKGDQVKIHAGANGVRFFIFTGMPLKEPVAWGGPIVMNTQEELALAFRQLEEGTFIQSK